MRQLCLSLSVSETSAGGHAHIPPEVMKEPQGRGWGNVWARMVWMLLGATVTPGPRMEELVVHLVGEGRLENSHPNLCTKNKGSHCLCGDIPSSKGAGGGAVPSSPALLAPQQDNAAAFTIKMFEKLSGCWSALSWATLSGTWPLPTEQRRLPGGNLCWGDGDRG